MNDEGSIPGSERARKADAIIARPRDYKVCESCESIVKQRVVHCPNCQGYRFDADPDNVARQAKILAARDQTSVRAEDLL